MNPNKHTHQLELDFEKIAQKIKILTKRPTDDELLKIYGLYKQSIEGDNNIQRPGFWRPTLRAKWDSWSENRGFRKEEAKQEYIKYAQFLLIKYACLY